jgi:D-serine deaminase-like pyridoxal phosphate-dependent protein
VTRLSEEHGVIDVPESERVRVGDRIVIVPNHVCPAINLASFVTVVDGGSAERWSVSARGLVQ